MLDVVTTVDLRPDPNQVPPRSAAYQWLGHVRELLDGHGTGRAYLNFRHHDPDNFFCHQQSIPLGTDNTDS